MTTRARSRLSWTRIRILRSGNAAVGEAGEVRPRRRRTSAWPRWWRGGGCGHLRGSARPLIARASISAGTRTRVVARIFARARSSAFARARARSSVNIGSPSDYRASTSASTSTSTNGTLASRASPAITHASTRACAHAGPSVYIVAAAALAREPSSAGTGTGTGTAAGTSPAAAAAYGFASHSFAAPRAQFPECAWPAPGSFHDGSDFAPPALATSDFTPALAPIDFAPALAHGPDVPRDSIVVDAGRGATDDRGRGATDDRCHPARHAETEPTRVHATLRYWPRHRPHRRRQGT